MSLWQSNLSDFTVIANEFDIFKRFTYIVFILQCQKKTKMLNCLKRAETSIILTIFDGVLCKIHA
jgi:hypothetical protein